jgi:hypothetical protein
MSDKLLRWAQRINGINKTFITVGETERPVVYSTLVEVYWYGGRTIKKYYTIENIEKHREPMDWNINALFLVFSIISIKRCCDKENIRADFFLKCEF